jgi:Holliday junction resolvase RusA-like endonuclease
MTALVVSVPGKPEPQGSMKSYGTGRSMVHSNEATLLPWRASVIAHVRQQMQAGGTWPIDGPVKVAVTFYLSRPKSAPKGRMWPEKKPDLDKLSRAALDSLEQAGALHSDAQVVMLGASKVYGTPGMTLTLRPMCVPAVTS